MSLIKKPKTTEAKRQANRRNGKLNPGPGEEARRRIRAARLQHGYYAKAEGWALDTLGEDSGELNKLRTKLRRKWSPSDGMQEELVGLLARAIWRMKRYDRMQEGHALEQAKRANRGRETRLHARMMRLKLDSAALQALAQSVADPHYLTTPADLEQMQALLADGVMQEMGEIALSLFHLLRHHAAAPPGGQGPDDRMDEMEKARRVISDVRNILNMPQMTPEEEAERGFSPRQSPPGQGTAALILKEMASADPQGAKHAAQADANHLDEKQWQAREPFRRVLENILMRQAQLYDAEHLSCLRQSLAGPTPFERAAEISPQEARAMALQRLEDANFRQVWRITNLLMKLKGDNRKNAKKSLVNAMMLMKTKDA